MGENILYVPGLLKNTFPDSVGVYIYIWLATFQIRGAGFSDLLGTSDASPSLYISLCPDLIPTVSPSSRSRAVLTTRLGRSNYSAGYPQTKRPTKKARHGIREDKFKHEPLGDNVGFSNSIPPDWKPNPRSTQYSPCLNWLWRSKALILLET